MFLCSLYNFLNLFRFLFTQLNLKLADHFQLNLSISTSWEILWPSSCPPGFQSRSTSRSFPPCLPRSPSLTSSGLRLEMLARSRRGSRFLPATHWILTGSSQVQDDDSRSESPVSDFLTCDIWRRSAWCWLSQENITTSVKLTSLGAILTGNNFSKYSLEK